MSRTRWIAVLTVLAMAVAAGAAYALVGSGASSGAAGTSSTSSAPSTTATTAPTTTEDPTTTAPPTTGATEPEPSGLRRGSKGAEVEGVQRRLTELGFDPGPADGSFGQATEYAVWAFQKLHGMAPDGVVGPAVLEKLAQPLPPTALVPDGGADRVEIDLRSQLLFLYRGDALRLVTHVSTGSRKPYCEKGYCGDAVTPAGSHEFLWRVNGWRTSHLGELYNPVYFTWSGIAVHGSPSVPRHPASHGCVRIPMHVAEYFPSLVSKGGAVYVLDGITAVGPRHLPDDTTTTTSPDTSTSSSSSTAPSSTSSSSSTTSSSSTSTSSTTSTTSPSSSSTTSAPASSSTSSTTTSTALPTP